MASRVLASDAEQLQKLICIAEEFDVAITLLDRDSLFFDFTDHVFYWFISEVVSCGGKIVAV